MPLWESCILGLLLALAGCRSPNPNGTPDAEDTDAVDTHVPTSDTADKDTGTSPAADWLQVTCTSDRNPLRYTCTVNVDPPQAVELRYSRDDGHSVERMVAGDVALGSHELPVLFLAPEQAYTVTATALTGTAPTGTALPGTAHASFTTGPLVDISESWLDMTGEATTGLIGTDLPCSSDPIAVIYDTRTGDLVWYGDLGPGTLGFLDMTMFLEGRTIAAETGTDLVEVDLQGNELARIVDARGLVGADPFNLGLHHDMFRHQGLFYVMFREEHHGTPDDVLDVIAILDEAGNIVGRWDPADHLALPTDWTGDFLHTNAIWVDSAGDIYLSWKNIDTIGKVTGDPTSPDFGTVQWVVAGTDEILEQPHLPVDWTRVDGADEFHNQHNLTLTPAGELALLDNGNGRGVIFEVDEGAGTVTAIGQYPTERSACGAQGTTDVTAAGNVLVSCMEGILREYDRATDTVVWETNVRCPELGDEHVNVPRWNSLDAW